MSAERGSTGFTMPIVKHRRRGRLRRFLESHDLFYAVAVVIAAAAFIIAVLAYFAGH